MIEWHTSNLKYDNGLYGGVGKFHFFSIHYDGCTIKDDDDKYQLKSYLPGIKPNLGHFETRSLAKEKANNVLKHWLCATNLTEN